MAVCYPAIHCASDVAVRSDQHSNACVQQLSSLRDHSVFPHVCLCLHWCQVRQQVFTDRLVLRHLLDPLRLHRHFRCQSWSRSTVSILIKRFAFTWVKSFAIFATCRAYFNVYVFTSVVYYFHYTVNQKKHRNVFVISSTKPGRFFKKFGVLSRVNWPYSNVNFIHLTWITSLHYLVKRGRRLHRVTDNLISKICTKLCQIRLRFMKDMTKHFGVFFWFTVPTAVHS